MGGNVAARSNGRRNLQEFPVDIHRVTGRKDFLVPLHLLIPCPGKITPQFTDRAVCKARVARKPRRSDQISPERLPERRGFP